MNKEGPPSPARITMEDWRLIRDTAHGLYVEVGTFHGASAATAAVNADRVITIDVYDWQPKVEWPDKVTFFKGTAVDFIETWSGEEINVLFLDGSHEYEYVMKDCESLIPLVKKGGFVLFHDWNPNNPHTGVYRAVNKYLKGLAHKKFPQIEGTNHMLKIQKL